MGVVDVVLRESKAKQSELLQVVREPGVLDTLSKGCKGQLAAQLLHDERELPDVHALAADRPHQELPVRCLELRGSKGNRQDLDAGILRPTFLDLRSRGENHEVGQRPRCRAIAGPQCSHLRIAAIRRRPRGEFRPVVERGAVVEDDAGERMRKRVDSFHGHASHLDDASHRVALASPLHAEEADRVGLVQIESDRSTAGLAKQSVLRRAASHAEDGVAFGLVPG